MSARIGLFGGSFDPVHYGHLILAETCREHLELDHVLLVPAANSPLKPEGPQATGEARAEMLRLAVEGTPALRVDTMELERGGVSFTLETVRRLQARDPRAELFLLVGADAVASLDQWKEPARLLSAARLGVVLRSGQEAPDFRRTALLLDPAERGGFRPVLVPMPELGLSSTDLRERISRGHSIRFRTPRAVEDYIEAQRLYR